jgi:hypothetical protein
MPQIIAWKSEYTGRIFECEKKYRSHIAEHKLKIRHKERHVRDLKRLHEYLFSSSSVQEYLDRIIEKQDWAIPRFIKDRKGNPINEIFTDIYIKAYYHPTCSNSHERPFNGVTNFHRKNDKPLNYPGLLGSIHGNMTGYYHNSEIFELFGLKTGSGGGGNNFRYQITIFEDDFPVIKDYIEKEKIRCKLSSREFRFDVMARSVKSPL